MRVQEVALEALRKRYVKILISDGQADGALKGGGDARDNIATILELAENKILPLSDAVALMTTNPAELLSQRTSEEWWKKEIGCLHRGSRADLIIVNPIEKEVCATFVNGRLVSFEGRLIRNGYRAGGFLTRRGVIHNTGIGYSNIFEYDI